MKRQIAQRAFSLVEVAVALGLSGFCLMAIFGLLTVGVNVNQVALRQTGANAILSAITADLQAAPSATAGESVTSEQFDIPIPGPPVSTKSAPAVVFLSEQGRSAPPAQAAYRAAVTFLPAPGGGLNTAILTYVNVTWPASASPENALGSAETIIVLSRN